MSAPFTPSRSRHVAPRQVHRGHVALAALVLAVLLPAAAVAGFDEQISIDADRLTLANLVGELRIEGYAGTAFELDVRVRGEDASREEVKIEVSGEREAEVFIAFPVSSKCRFVYPEMGRRSKTELSVSRGRKKSLLERELAAHGARKIRVSGSGRGKEIWADITLRVPAGKEIRIELGVGRVEVESVEASTEVDVMSASVWVSGVGGDLRVDTGSGHVEAERVRGSVNIDTGSGHVTLVDCDGEYVAVDTGSGHVEADQIVSRSLEIDTGSGHVTARAVSADRASIDTGSGQVKLDLVRMGAGPYAIDTGSGSISLRLPADASATVHAETGSGGIRVDLDGVDVRRRHDDEIRFTVGGGDARVKLETGSGSVRIRGR